MTGGAVDLVEESSARTVAPDTVRLLGFSDAVFAIAITLLGLDLADVPESILDASQPLGPFLRGHIDDALVYAGTFLVVGFLWSRHHALFRYVKRRSGAITWLNIVVLAMVVLIPYPAALVSRAPTSGLAQTALLAPLLVVAVVLAAMWEVALLGRSVIPGLPSETRAYMRAMLLTPVAVLTVALVMAQMAWRTDEAGWAFAAVGCCAAMVMLPLAMRWRWPTPQQATAVVPAPTEDDELAREGGQRRVEGLLTKLRSGSDTERLCIFSDGVFAIAVTVLGLQIQPPPRGEVMTNDSVAAAISSVAWIPYLITFIFISLYWVLHVRVFDRVVGADAVVLALNLVFLMFIGAMPLPMELTIRIGNSVAVSVLYFGVLLAASAALAAIDIYAATSAQLSVDYGDARKVRWHVLRSLWICGVFLATVVAIIIADSTWPAAVLPYLIIARTPVLRLLAPGSAPPRPPRRRLRARR